MDNFRTANCRQIAVALIGKDNRIRVYAFYRRSNGRRPAMSGLNRIKIKIII